MNRLVVFGVTLLSLSCLPASAQGINIFRKTLADKQQIVVTRQEIPASPPTPQQKAAEEQYIKEHPHFSFSVHLYQYLFNLISADGKRQATLWVHQEGGPAPAPKTGIAIEGNQSIQVLDATVQDGVLIVAYQQGLWAEGAVVEPDRTHGRRVLPGEYDNDWLMCNHTAMAVK